jgi:hypothetical protein
VERSQGADGGCTLIAAPDRQRRDGNNLPQRLDATTPYAI